MIKTSTKPMTAEEFREHMSLLPAPPSDSRPPLWDFWRHDLYERVSSGEDPRYFFSWPCIYHTMLTKHWGEANKVEFSRLALAGQRFTDATIYPDFGYPSDEYFLKYSGSLIHQAHHIFQWELWADTQVSKMDTVFEFGGGYGAMALVMRRLGFMGEYTIMDLPEFSLLQQYYLSNVGVNGVGWVQQPFDVHFIPVQDLMIACFSLSEVDYAHRYYIMRRVVAKNYLFLYTNRFADHDNIEYFQQIIPTMWGDVDWHHQAATHLPEGIYYTFGRRKVVHDNT